MARRAPDREMQAMRRILSILEDMPVPQRRRVLQYVTDRVDLLPPFMPNHGGTGEKPSSDLLETA